MDLWDFWRNNINIKNLWQWLLIHYNYYEFILQGHTLDQGHYVEILKRLHEAVRRKILKIWRRDWILHHDNAPAHKPLSVKQFLAQKSITKT
jgi:hypothetical protein